MRFLAALGALAAAAVCASAQAVRQPWLPFALFGYPSADFNYLYQAIAAHPEIVFEIIVNPAGGPGSVNNTGLPDINWQNTVKKLKSYPNTVLVGYSRTKWTYGEWFRRSNVDWDGGPLRLGKCAVLKNLSSSLSFSRRLSPSLAAGNRDPTQNKKDIDIYNRWGLIDPSMAIDGVFLDVSARRYADMLPYGVSRPCSDPTCYQDCPWQTELFPAWQVRAGSRSGR